MESAEDTPILRCDNMLVSSRGITETQGKKVAIFVPTGEIERATLRFGRSDHRPVISMLLGTVFVLIGIYGLVYLILALAGYRYEMGMVVFGLIGGSIIFDTLKKRYFFEVYKKKDNCRLVFSKNAQLKDIQDFCNKVRTMYKYQISDDA